MSQLDTYRNAVLKKREELAKLKEGLAKEQAKISPLQKRIISTRETISKTKNQTMIKNRIKEIERDNKSLAEINKSISGIQKKMAQKEKELITAEKNMRNEENRVSKRKDTEEKRRIKEHNAQLGIIEETIKQQAAIQDSLKSDIDRLMALPKKITVLFFASNPGGTSILRLDEEVRAIQERIRLSEYRDSILFESRWAVRSSDILQAINETNPTIVHFSGHGSTSGDIVLTNPDGTLKYVSAGAMSAAISTASDTVRFVVYNACFSDKQAQSVVDTIEAAIGMNDAISDKAALVFAAQLYSAIGFGYSLDKAFNQAIAAIKLEGIIGENTPQIFCKDNVELRDIILVDPGENVKGDTN